MLDGTNMTGRSLLDSDSSCSSGALVSNYLSEINKNTYTKSSVKNVEDVQLIIGYFNRVIADIQAQKKKV